jgi:hypothetical protein
LFLLLGGRKRAAAAGDYGHGDGGINFLDAAKGGIILPVYANDIFDSAVALGLVFGLSGGGAVIGAFIALSLLSFVLAVFPPV